MFCGFFLLYCVQECISFIKLLKCCYSHYFCDQMCPTLPPLSSRPHKIVSPEVLHCLFIH
jgi:hypothetical protein